MIKNFIFDVGNVILGFDQDGIISNFTLSKNEHDFLVNNVINSPEWLGEALIDTGFIRVPEAIRIAQDRTDHTHDALIRNFWLNYTQYHTIDTEVIDLIKELRQKGYRVYLLSNMNPENYILLSSKSDLFENVDGMVLSFLEHEVKPHIGIYNTLLKRYDLEAEECVFIDDSKRNVDTAKRIGFNAEQVEQNNYDDVLNAVRKWDKWKKK